MEFLKQVNAELQEYGNLTEEDKAQIFAHLESVVKIVARKNDGDIENILDEIFAELFRKCGFVGYMERA